MISYRLATTNDNQQLIDLTASSGMAGDIGLRIDRKPDFFALLQMRGDTKVFVAEENKRIIGCICVSLQQVYVGGAIYPLRYIGDFKVHEAYRNRGVGLQLCNAMADHVIAQDSDLAFLNVSMGNKKPISFFKDRPNVPDFDNIGIFNIYQFIGKKNKGLADKFSIERSAVTEEVVDYFNSHYRDYQLGAVLTEEKFEGTQVFLVRQQNKIAAAMSLVDTMPLKQNVITHLSSKMKLLLKLINVYSRMAGLSRMPVLNEPVKMLYIKHLAASPQSLQLVKPLVNFARDIAFERSYSYVSIGLHERDRFNNCFGGMLKLTFRSAGMLLSIKNNRNLIAKVKQGVPHEDYSMV